MHRFDYALVGGGLQSSLIALALLDRRPDTELLMVERGDVLGGNHTWCFHGSDVDGENRSWLAPLIQYRWPGYRVRFPGREQALDEEYCGLSSRHLHDVVTRTIEGSANAQLLLRTNVTSVDEGIIEVADGTAYRARVVVDARGPAPSSVGAPAGFQKFVGQEVELTTPHGLERPILMDARVSQEDGYRFFYVLPFGPRTLLIEDTRFSDSPKLSRDVGRSEIARYAAAQGWEIARVEREEEGVLPMPWSGDFTDQSSGPLSAGYRGGWFHPGTGYSFPVAVRLAEFIGAVDPGDLFGPEYRRLADAHREQLRRAHFLNRLLFRWYPPEDRTSIFERFYRLPAETVRNFYALRLDRTDMVRLLGGRPPRGLSLRYRLGR